jgi:outer-membrane lipoprotein carrier protein
MKRTLVLTTYILLIISSLQAQGTRKFTESQKQAFEKQFIDKSRSISTLQSAFIQTKTSTMVSQSAVSKGNMYYRNPSMLIWEYTSPSKSLLIVDGRSTRLLDENGNIVGNKNVSKQLGSLIINMINGNSIVDNKLFTTEIFEIANNQILVVLTPQQRRLKDFYSTIKIKVDRNTLIATEISMDEKSGDNTVVSFTNIQLNKDIPTAKFKIK